MPDPANLAPDGGTISLLLVIHDDPSYYGYFPPGESSRQLLTLPPPEEVLPRPVNVCFDLVEVPLEKAKFPKNQPTKLVDEACAATKKEECRERATAVVDAAVKEWRDAQELNEINNGEIGLIGTIAGTVLSLSFCALLGVSTAGVGFVPCIVREIVVSQSISETLGATNDGVLLDFADATTTFVRGAVEVIRSDTLVDIKEQCIQCKPLCPAGKKPCLDGPCIPEGDCCLPEDLRCNPGPCRDPYSCCGGDEVFCVDRCLDSTSKMECPFTENRICVDVGECCPGLQKKCDNSCINTYECCPSDNDCSSNEICGEVATAGGTEFVCSACEEGHEPNDDATQCVHEQCPGELVTCPDGQCSFSEAQCFEFGGDGECNGAPEETVENCREDCFVGPFFVGTVFVMSAWAKTLTNASWTVETALRAPSHAPREFVSLMCRVAQHVGMHFVMQTVKKMLTIVSWTVEAAPGDPSHVPQEFVPLMCRVVLNVEMGNAILSDSRQLLTARKTAFLHRFVAMGTARMTVERR